MPRARLVRPEGGTTEWKSQALRAYQRRTLAAEALIASAYLAGVNTRRVRRALTALFDGAVGKDTVSRPLTLVRVAAAGRSSAILRSPTCSRSIMVVIYTPTPRESEDSPCQTARSGFYRTDDTARLSTDELCIISST